MNYVVVHKIFTNASAQQEIDLFMNEYIIKHSPLKDSILKDRIYFIDPQEDKNKNFNKINREELLNAIKQCNENLKSDRTGNCDKISQLKSFLTFKSTQI